MRTTTTSPAATAANPSTGARVLASLHNSAGEIVFGMEDGTVSIFGLVFGVAASAPNSHTVLLAGATGAAAAAVSMMAGTYLQVESANDARTAALEQRAEEHEADPHKRSNDQRDRLKTMGFGPDEIDVVVGILGRHPETADDLDAVFELGIAPTQPQKPLVQATWMLLADLIAATIPVLPFAWFALSSARVVSMALTGALLVVLGVGRARIASKPVIPTTIKTLGIAVGAAAAGLIVGQLIA